jgi:hypothetical protein
VQVRRQAALSLALALLPSPGVSAEDRPRHRETRSIGLVESAGARLAQLDVIVTGPRDAASALVPGDFDVSVGGRKIEAFELDRACAAASTAKDPRPAAARAASYLFYFDQRHLTPAGRRRALQAARDIVPRLIAGGSRGMLVSSARTLRAFTELTSRPDEILDGLEEIEKDPWQTDPSAVQEELRIAEVEATLMEEREATKGRSDVQKYAAGSPVTLIDVGQVPRSGATPSVTHGSHGGPLSYPGLAGEPTASGVGSFEAVADAGWARAASLARQYARDEAADGAADFERLAAAVGRLTDVPQPKAIVYFADTARRNAGEHFTRLFDERGPRFDSGAGSISPERARAELDAAAKIGAQGAFDSVLREAAADGVRFYAVQADGLAPDDSRIRDAQDTLAALALESGGRPFLNGVPADRMAESILEDLSCVYLISFRPEGIPEDVPLPVRIGARVPGLETRARGHLVVQSEAARSASRVRDAFSSASEEENGTISAAVIPTGSGRGGRFALIQVAVPSPAAMGGSWEIGVSLVSGRSVREISKRKIATNASNVPMVLEEEEKLPGGRSTVLAVARESRTGLVVSRRLEIDWPESDGGLAIGPIAVLEPAAGAFVRGKSTRTEGSLARSESEPLRADRPAALIGVVCRPKERPATVRVERRLVGASVLDLTPLTLDLRKEVCAQFRDVVPAGNLGPGRFLYEVIAASQGLETARRERSFVLER